MCVSICDFRGWGAAIGNVYENLFDCREIVRISIESETSPSHSRKLYSSNHALISFGAVAGFDAKVMYCAYSSTHRQLIYRLGGEIVGYSLFIDFLARIGCHY